MLYHCGHRGCDICGVRECSKRLRPLNWRGPYLICEPCLTTAVKFAYEAAATFGGTIIDSSKPCGKDRRRGPTNAPSATDRARSTSRRG